MLDAAYVQLLRFVFHTVNVPSRKQLPPCLPRPLQSLMICIAGSSRDENLVTVLSSSLELTWYADTVLRQDQIKVIAGL